MVMSTEQAARRLGMKVSEVVDVEETDGGDVVTTHDGQRVLVTDAAVLPYVGGEAEDAGEAVVDAAAVVADEHARLQQKAADDGTQLGGLDVPDGPTAQVLDWVADDPGRAAAALAAEQAKASPRSTLIAALEKLVTQ